MSLSTGDTALCALVARKDLKPEKQVSLVLSKLQDILRRKSVHDGAQLDAFKQDLYRDGVLKYCADVLNLNYEKVDGGYASATQIAEILSSCCVGVKLDKDELAFHRRLLPSVTDNLLSLALRLMTGLEENGQPEMLHHFRKVMASLCWLLKGHNHLTSQALQSTLYEHIQMSEDERVKQVCLSLWQQVLSTNSELLADLRLDCLSVFLDDVAFELTNSSHSAVGGAAVRLLLLVARQKGTTLRFIINRFRGLDKIISKEYRGRGLDEEVDELLNLLHSGAHEPVKTQVSEECVRAACVIQAAWRACLTRRRVKKLPGAVSTLQRSFRERRRRREQQAQEERWAEELRLQVCARRQKARREFHQRQLELLHLLPPGQVQRYLGEVEKQAAVIIQKVWRGHKERRRFKQVRHTLSQYRAAVVLQRAVVRFLKKQREEKVPPLPSPWISTQGLTDRRRAELKKEVDEYIAFHPSSVVSEGGTRELHTQTQALLLQHLQGREAERKAHIHTQALLAQINTDLELLMNAPAVSVASTADCEMFRSRSAPVAARARQSHNAILQGAKLPWWKMLGNDNEFIGLDSESELPGHLEIEFDTLFMPGSKEKLFTKLL
ncbi:IQ calmodulin-binding motif-containing protein 1-like [Hypomesus transpacificus]|uniref:IQ calmodulin-binding motif-containing protein 1-like n=1 Tax=Hypomesus transpacificus TaxID=137520 RepID=UPI001F076FF5|nr:IQ calmodulin-binding motif-containing protein 1-like [Hypomesus transpacificus]